MPLGIMAGTAWPTSTRAITSLYLDQKNPRLGRESEGKAPREIVQFLFDHDKAIEVARSIAFNGFFPNEPLLAVNEGNKTIVVEGNRRLAALKALKEPGLLEGMPHRQVDRLRREISDLSSIAKVPVTIAPNRRATDRLLAVRHVETPVLSWTKENKSSFILDKLDEGYTNERLKDRLGFSAADIQKARQFRALADMARSIPLEEEIKAKVQNPRAKLFTNIERVFNSKEGRKALRIKPDEDHGIKIQASKKGFEQAFGKLVSDIALGKQTSRTLNTEEQIKDYFSEWPSKVKPKKSSRPIVPADIITKKSVASSAVPQPPKAPAKRPKPASKKVVPRNFTVRHGSERIQDLRKELGKIDRYEMPNAGAMLLRVFLELAMIDYLKRNKLYNPLMVRLKGNNQKITMKQLANEFRKIAKKELGHNDYNGVLKALTYDKSKPFNVTELNNFIHSNDLPTGRDIEQFWIRTEPLFRLMLTED